MPVKCKFRFHRGGLKESLETTVEVSSKQELCKIVNKHYNLALAPDDIIVKYYTRDERIDWDTYIVTAKGLGASDFTNTKLL